jgi:hypothetical protein
MIVKAEPRVQGRFWAVRGEIVLVLYRLAASG